MDNRECIVHYHSQAKYSTIKELSVINKEKISASKLKREHLGNDNHLKGQCDQIPTAFEDSKHGIHLEPCYKR